jgi:uncharacterized protein YqhQ
VDGALSTPAGRSRFSPNLALQRLTTREPEVGMIEVAIAAFEAMRRAESEQAVDTLS